MHSVHTERTRHGREDELRKAEQAMASGHVVRNRFVRVADKRAVLDHMRIAADARLDGLHGVWTSLRDLEAGAVRQRYAELSRIEHGFRVIKHDLAARPVFHLPERRVRAHVAICFAAFGLFSALSWRMRVQRCGIGPVSEGRLLEELRGIQPTIVLDPPTGRRILLGSHPTRLQKAIYRCVNLDIPQHTALLN